MDATTHHLRIRLLRVNPKVTRDLLVPSNLGLDRLHQVLQVAMGWENAHQHEYIVGTLRNGRRFGTQAPPSLFGFDGPRTQSEKRFTLQQIAPTKGSKFLYWYDFGDDWHHEIAVKNVGVLQADFETPHCIDGAGACPPEDCGGQPGYANLLEALSDPNHEDHEELLDWIGGKFDPAAFDIDAVNDALALLIKRWNNPARRRRTPVASAAE